MFFGGELRSSVRISHGSETFGFRCRATPIIIIITSIPKSSIGNLKDKIFFGGASFEDLMAVLDSQVWEKFLTRYCNKKLCLHLASCYSAQTKFFEVLPKKAHRFSSFLRQLHQIIE